MLYLCVGDLTVFEAVLLASPYQLQPLLMCAGTYVDEPSQYGSAFVCKPGHHESSAFPCSGWRKIFILCHRSDSKKEDSGRKRRYDSSGRPCDFDGTYGPDYDE